MFKTSTTCHKMHAEIAQIRQSLLLKNVK